MTSGGHESEPLIELRDVVKQYGEKTVLNGISLQVRRGETLVVIGGSGSGKTTLARIVMGLEKPSAGQVLLKGVDLSSLRGRRLTAMRTRFAMVFQKSALLDSLTVFDNVAFPLREETRLDEPTIRERVHLKLSQLGIEDAAHKLPGELSGGMAKRAAIARAMVTEPEILVYDEPTSGLDPLSSRVVDELIEQMRERFFVTSVVITHDMVTAFHIADRVALLARGTIVTSRSPDDLLQAVDSEIRRFAASSGVDFSQLHPPRPRRSPTEIRMRWDAAHADQQPEG